MCRTGVELIQRLKAKPSKVYKLLWPSNGVMNLSNITREFGISSKDEEAKFIKKLNNIQKYIDRR